MRRIFFIIGLLPFLLTNASALQGNSFKLDICMFGYDDLCHKDFAVVSDSQVIDLTSTDTLTKESKSLPEVVVQAKWLYRKDGNAVINVAQMTHTKDLQTSQLLQRLPGVTKKNDGYLLNGKPAAIYINGVRQNISASSMQAFLSNLPAEALSTIELVGLNTGTYSATTDGVIRINMRANMPLGYSFQPYVFSSFLPEGVRNAGGNIFYMTKLNRILTYHTLSYANNRIRLQQSDSLLLHGVRLLNNERRRDGRSHVLTYQGALSYELNQQRKLLLNTFVYNDWGQPEAQWHSNSRYGREVSSGRSDLYNLSLAYQIPAAQRAFHGTIAYAFSYGSEHTNTRFYNEQERLYEDMQSNMEGWMHTLNADISSYVGEQWLFTYGLQIDRNSVWNKVAYVNQQLQSTAVPSFTGTELLPACYLQARYRYNSALTLRVGLRLEHTAYQYAYSHTPTLTHRSYTNLFPTVLLYYDRPNYGLVLGLTSRISRPKYSWMLPGVRVVNDFLSFEGHPEIQPSQIYALVARNTLFQYAQLNLSYGQVHHFVGSSYRSEGKRLVESMDNIAKRSFFTANVVLPFALMQKKLTGQLQANVDYSRLSDFTSQYQAPHGRAPRYWTHSYSASLEYTPNNRFSCYLQGELSPQQNTLFSSSSIQFSGSMELNYSLLKERNLVLSLSTYNLFSHPYSKVHFFLDNSFHTTNYSTEPYIQISMKLRLNKGQHVVDEYRSYTPVSSSRLQ